VPAFQLKLARNCICNAARPAVQPRVHTAAFEIRPRASDLASYSRNVLDTSINTAAVSLSSDNQGLNEDAIGELARETGQPIARVRQVYEEQFARLAANARIRDYLALFAMKRTRERLAR
jgi:hypothetical protein